MEHTEIMDTIANNASTTGLTNNIWFWIALSELLIIVSTLVYYRNKRKDANLIDWKRKVKKEGDINFSNTLKSAFHAKELYDQLKVKCHPDRFPNDPEKKMWQWSCFN